MKPSTRAASGPSSITCLRHCQRSALSSTPRLRVMFDHFWGPAILRTTGLPLASFEVCSMTSVDESRPAHSRKLPIASLPPMSRRNRDAGRGSLAGIAALLSQCGAGLGRDLGGARGELADPEDHELGRLDRRDADLDHDL